jgi:hypothetical protein
MDGRPVFGLRIKGRSPAKSPLKSPLKSPARNVSKRNRENNSAKTLKRVRRKHSVNLRKVINPHTGKPFTEHEVQQIEELKEEMLEQNRKNSSRRAAFKKLNASRKTKFLHKNEQSNSPLPNYGTVNRYNVKTPVKSGRSNKGMIVWEK